MPPRLRTVRGMKSPIASVDKFAFRIPQNSPAATMRPERAVLPPFESHITHRIPAKTASAPPVVSDVPNHRFRRGERIVDQITNNTPHAKNTRAI